MARVDREPPGSASGTGPSGVLRDGGAALPPPRLSARQPPRLLRVRGGDARVGRLVVPALAPGPVDDAPQDADHAEPEQPGDGVDGTAAQAVAEGRGLGAL